MSHMETVLSPEPDAKICEKGYHCTLLTESTWPRYVKRDLFMFRSHILTEWSIEQDSKKSPVSWKATFHTG